jgi:hypothetical protein
VHYTKGSVQGGIVNILDRLNVACRVADDGREVVRTLADWPLPVVGSCWSTSLMSAGRQNRAASRQCRVGLHPGGGRRALGGWCS